MILIEKLKPFFDKKSLSKTLKSLPLIVSIIGGIIAYFIIKKSFPEIPIDLTLLMIGIGVFLTIIFAIFKKTEETPNIWTGLGILFTFIAFLIAFKNPEIWKETNLLEVLIPKISSAFTTSIVGIAMSKLIILSIKISESIIDKEKEKKEEQPEQVLIAIRNEIRKSTENNIEHNRQNEIVINNLSGILNSFETTFKRLADNIGVNVSQQISDNMSNIINEFTENSKKSFNQHNEITKEGLDEVSRTNKELINQQQEQSENQIETINNKLQEAVESFNEIMTNNVDNLDKTFDRLENWSNAATEKTTELNVQFRKLIDLQTNTDDSQRQILVEIEKQLAEIEEIRKERKIDAEAILNDNITKNKLSNLSKQIEKIIELLKKAA